MPAPVTVRVPPDIVPGPETTVNVTPRPELAVAERLTGETPYVTGEAGGVKVIVCVPCVIVNVPSD